MPAALATGQQFTNPNIDFRRWARYRLKAQVTFSWQEKDGSTVQGQGFTRDIGLTGAYIYSKTCPQVGTQLRLSIYFPTRPTSVRALRTHSMAEVVRRDRDLITGESGFAVLSRLALVRKTYRRIVPESNGSTTDSDTKRE